MKLILYSTSACHLCEQAKEILWPLLGNYPIQLCEVDIAGSDELLERYGVRIPVFKFSGADKEIGWPFGSAELQKFLQEGVA